MRSACLVMLFASCTPDERPAGSPDAGCDEPDPRDPKGLAEGDPCETSFQCNSANLVCLGMGLGSVAVCTSDTAFENDRGESIELWDDGCYARPEEATLGHCSDPDGLEANAIAEVVGCEGQMMTYEIPDGCCWNGTRCANDCTDFQRREVWRNCGCCWRLVSLVERYPEFCR